MQKHSWKAVTGGGLIALAVLVTCLIWYGEQDNQKFIDRGVERTGTVIFSSADERFKQSESKYTLRVMLNTAVKDSSKFESTGDSLADMQNRIREAGKININMETVDVRVDKDVYTSSKSGDKVDLLVLIDEDPPRAKLASTLKSNEGYTVGYVLVIVFGIIGVILLVFDKKKSSFSQ